MNDEPMLEADDIQGHIAPGFGTRHQYVIGLDLVQTGPARAILFDLVGQVTSMRVAKTHRDRRRQALLETGERPDDPEVMMAIAVSAKGVRRLGRAPEEVADPFFTQGQAADAAALRDPIGPHGVLNWRVGATPETTPDVLLILASERESALMTRVSALLTRFGATVDLLYEEAAQLLPGDIEHFGFRDGISQPAPRGRLDADTPLIRRRFPASGARADTHAAAPGQPLLWPGQFIFGYQGQAFDSFAAGSVAEPGASWMRNVPCWCFGV